MSAELPPLETGIPGVVLRPLSPFHDPRGWLAEFHRDDVSPHRSVMGYISVTLPGIARGPHEHRDQTDLFVFAGPGDFDLYLYDAREGGGGKSFKLTVGATQPVSATVPPGVIHAYRCVSDVPGWVINLPDRLYKGEGRSEPVDEIRHEHNPDSPFYKVFERNLFS